MNEREIMRRLLEKFRFTAPVPGDVRKEMSARRKSGLVSILKMKKKYGVFITPVIWFFFLARRMGVTITIAKCTVIVWTIIIMITGIVTTGAVYTLKHFTAINAAPEAPAIPGRDDASRAGDKSPPAPFIAEDTPASIGVVPFEFVGTEAGLADRVTRQIGGSLIRSRGARKVIYAGGAARPGQAKTLLMGTVVKLSDGYRITARLVDTASSRILVFASEKISSAEDVDGACAKISQKVLGAAE